MGYVSAHCSLFSNELDMLSLAESKKKKDLTASNVYIVVVNSKEKLWCSEGHYWNKRAGRDVLVMKVFLLKIRIICSPYRSEIAEQPSAKEYGEKTYLVLIELGKLKIFIQQALSTMGYIGAPLRFTLVLISCDLMHV